MGSQVTQEKAMQIEDLLEIAVSEHASDLHLLPGMPPLLRIDGDLKPIEDHAPLTGDETKNLIYHAMTKEQQHTLETNLVFDMATYFGDLGNFRLSVFHELNGVAGVFRVIPDNIPSFEELLLPPILKRFLIMPHGLVLVAGPTGCGKSTTLAVMIEYINMTRHSHIITIEDPIEFIHKSKKSAINQIQVGRDTPDFATALRASLRQDPDVILLGEMRDLETIRLALIAAETGHLVLGTLHASSASAAISRMVDVFPNEEKNRTRNLLSETIQAVICQTLVKKVTGGRVAAFEIMLATPAIRHLILQDMMQQMETTIQTNGDIGMCTLAQYLQKLVAKHLITLAVARSVIAAHESFKLPLPTKKKK